MDYSMELGVIIVPMHHQDHCAHALAMVGFQS